VVDKCTDDIEEGINMMRREAQRLANENFNKTIEKVEKFYSVKAECDLKELREAVFMLNEDLDTLNKKFSREKHIFSTSNVDLMQERLDAKKLAENVRNTQEKLSTAKLTD